jgi:hypothetical protein
MRVEALFLLFLAAFGVVASIVYWFWGYEDGGTVMLVAFGLLGLLPGSYYLWWSKRMTPRAEDDPHADVEAGSGIVATFPSSSIWPFVLGMGAAMVALALVFGFWTAIFGFALVISAVIGVIFESRHGGYA